MNDHTEKFKNFHQNPTKENAEIFFRGYFGSDELRLSSILGIFRCKVVLGTSCKDAFDATIEQYIDIKNPGKHSIFDLN